MATITDITEQKKKKSRVNLYLDGKFCLGLEKLTVLKNGLKIGNEIDLNDLENIQVESESNVAFEYCIEKISRKMCTTKEIETALKNKGYVSKVVLQVIEKLSQYKYIDDEQFSNVLIRDKKTCGKRALEQKLYQKGIAKDTIYGALSHITPQDEEFKADLVAQKYMRNKECKPENKIKLFRHLVARGFEYDTAKNVTDKIFFSMEEN